MNRLFPTTLLAVALAAGCGQNRSAPRAKWAPSPKAPPAAPAAADVPFDSLLREAAARQIAQSERSDIDVTRAHAVEAHQEARDAGAGRAILRGLSDSSDVVRFASAMAAGQVRLADARPQLMKMLEDRSPNVQVAVRFALHKLGETRFTHDLEQLAFNTDPAVRANAALAIGLIGHPSGLNVLQGMQKDPNVMVRFQVAESRWRLGDMQGARDLVTGTVSRYADDQLVSYVSLAAPRDARMLEHVRGGLVSGFPEVALAAARAAGQLGSDEGYGVALQYYKSTDPRQRALAALAFGAIARRDAQPYLGELLKDREEEVRLAAATAILQLR
jgi:HEAT repeat protein